MGAAPGEDTPPPYAAVAFDCDSTLASIEGIDALAAFASPGTDLTPDIAALTSAAMDGEIPLEEVYGRRLDILRPTSECMARLGDLYVAALLPGAIDLVAALHDLGKDVIIVSGGLRPAVLPLAAVLGIAPERVHAVELAFHSDGAYAGYETDSPLARAGGKAQVLTGIGASLPGAMALVGDGVTDLEAAAAVDRFIAFAGVVERPGVVSAARVVCHKRDLSALVPLLFSKPEIDRLASDPHHAALLSASPTSQSH